MFGVIAAPILIIVGTLLCLTGLGAFLGVPMILAAILAPLIGPLIGIGEHTVRCPSCATRMITVADSKLHYCPTCEKEFAAGRASGGESRLTAPDRTHSLGVSAVQSCGVRLSDHG